MEKGSKRFHIITYGCQMNQYDSGIISEILKKEGYIPVNNERDADIVILNTCAVREHAEKRVMGRIHSLGRLKRHKNIKIGIVGCMAKRLPELLEIPEVDFVAGPDAYRNLPVIIGREGVFEEGNPFEDYNEIWPLNEGISAYVSISRGCDNFCSYCIVPYVRGPLRSRPVDTILEEVEYLVAQGVKEIILLGQNVNEYNYKGVWFASLLGMVADIKGVEMLNFLTSHPKDIDYNMFMVMAEKKNMVRYLHLPVQAGNNRILKLMNRHYTVEEYRDTVKRLRSILPDVTLTTDLLVGFPGETEKEFMDTLALVEDIRFDHAFMFRFSPRPGTLAALMEDKLTDEEKIKRLRKLIEVQNRITRERNKEMLGKSFRCIVMKPAKKGGYLCKTWTGKYIAVSEKVNIGDVISVKVTHLRGNTPVGITQKDKEE